MPLVHLVQDRKTNGTEKNKINFEWEYTHNDIEVYNGRGNHLGSMDWATGEMYKSVMPGQTIKINKVGRRDEILL